MRSWAVPTHFEGNWMRKKQGLAIRWHSEHAVRGDVTQNVPGLEEIPLIQ